MIIVVCLQRGWNIVKDTCHFKAEPKHTSDEYPARQLAKQTIEYARELEMIV
jgi:hypothetical protein